ncbi:hypothetical protein FSARC_7713 [Fusarium sarcochroum]|uniref:Uncharacterized protein n=1 Tax=Fusarium sarcochroum TaxID=1208366 RepID=A0A8H4TUM3_9HYPO|nr:hypothetical protein FSARC_7713 [Fusarium sarcochroum]
METNDPTLSQYTNQDEDQTQNPNPTNEADRALERKEERRRREQMTPEEIAADKERCSRAHYARARRRATKGLDLIEMALSGQQLTEEQCAALLGQPTYSPDATAFLRSLDGYLEEMGDMREFKDRLSRNILRVRPFLLRSPDLCKFVLIDWKLPNAQRTKKRGPSTALNYLYKKHLKRQHEGGRLEQARTVARHGTGQHDLEVVQYWARKMLHEYEAAIEREEPLDDVSAYITWMNILPKEPAWVDEIDRWGQDFGFVCYTSAEVERRPVKARERWFSVFNERGSDDGYSFEGYRSGAYSFSNAFILLDYMKPLWQSPCPAHGLPYESRPSAFRKHFRTLAAPNLESPRMSRNTFLVLHDDCVFPELDHHDLELGEIYCREAPPPIGDSGLPLLQAESLPDFFLWAYDANWEPPTRPNEQAALSTEGCTCQGTFSGGYDGADEDGYQGRVRIDLSNLFTWFYFARHIRKDVDLKDIWRIAQDMPNQAWYCNLDQYDPYQPGSAMPK